uniref:hypothetical protein n=1 Tax=Intrasporangium sp. TaxID=1925024 RepID=UPI00322196E2
MQHGDLGPKARWVLRNARAYAADPALRAASGFAAGAGRAPAVHRSQVGRWEGGAVAVTHDLVRRYEQVLDLPDGRLLAAVDVFSRTMLHPPPVPFPLPPPGEPDGDETLELVERALGTDRMTGADWDRLSRDLARLPHVLLRACDWEAMLRRCNAELGLSLELDFVQRYNAAVRLSRHPRSGTVVARLADEALHDPAEQLYVDAASVLRYTAHPAVVEVLLHQLRDPTNDHALRSALLALTSLVARGNVTGERLAEAVRLAVGHLRDTDRSFLVRRGAANLVHAADLPDRQRIAAGLTADSQQFAASIIVAGRARRADDLRGLRSRVRQTLARTLTPGDLEEPVLDTVIGAALGETNEETSGNALAILMLSPQGPVVGRAYVDELVEALRSGDEVATHECLAVLSWLMQPEALDVLTDLACDPGTDDDVAYAALNAVGNAGEPAGAARPARDERLRTRLVEVVGGTTRQSGAETLMRGYAYAIGMRGRYDLLEAVLQELEAGRLRAAS